MVDKEVKECREKFVRLLHAIKPQDLVRDDTFFEKIQTYLTQKEYSDFVKDPEVKRWITTTVEAFDSDDESLIPSQQVATFTLKILCFICSNEWDFVTLKEDGLLDKIKSGLEKHPQLRKASIKLAHLQLLHAISSHSIGLHWIKRTKIWNLIISYFITNPTIYIMREASAFIFEILVKFSELMKDEEACIEALEAVLGPVINYKKCQEPNEVRIDDESFVEKFLPYINMATELLLLCIEANKRTRLAYYIIGKYQYERKLWFVLDSVHSDKAFLTAGCRSHNAANVARLSCMDIPASDTKITDISMDLHALHFYNLMKYCTTCRIFRNINMIAEMHHQLWHKLGDRAPNEIVLEYHDLKFGDQIVLIQLFPVLHIIQTRYKANNEYINKMCTKIFNKSCEHTTRLLYEYRDALSYETFDFITDLASNSVQSIISMKKFLRRDRATLAFQILIHVLKGYAEESAEEEMVVASDKNNHIGLVQLVLQAPNLLSSLLIALNKMIKRFTFTWKECVESTAIVPLLLALLENPNLSSRHVVEALKLIQTAIEHFLAPNMALLMDKVEGNGMENLGPTIFKKLHDLSWEVRDSTLELIHAIVEISNEKFPPFQAHLLNNKICQTVEIVARNDSEPYVRASALKALAAMIKIRLFWEHALHSLDVKKYAVETLANESEGVVRREAVACITSIYHYQQIPEHCLDVIFSVLAHCAVNDFYWEAKINALSFWKLVICRQFTHQGMIDGTFPAVTFSKEHKKIVTLNDKEIHLRLRKVLNELSLRGCLGILVSCLQDSDLSVLKKTVEIVDRMMGYLNKYNYVEEYQRSKSGTSSKVGLPVMDSNYADFKSLGGAKDTEIRNTADLTKSTEVCMSAENGEICSIDTVIDSIIQCNDLTLLSKNYHENLKLNQISCNTGEIDEKLFKKFAQVSADDFLSYIATQNLQQLVQDKSDWLQHSETFSSLLDDVLRNMGDHNVDLDCY